MPKQFGEEERRAIDGRLREVAAELFARGGTRGVSVEELASSAAISKGSFYSFYPTKEALLFSVVRDEERRLQRPVREELEALDPPTRDGVFDILQRSILAVESNPVLRRMLDVREFDRIMRNVPAQYHTGHRDEDRDVLGRVFAQWQKAGLIRPDPPESLVGAVRSLYLLTLHRRELGEDTFDAARSQLLRLVVDGLFCGRGGPS
ncbi:MAG: TetR/AcrR family transcriptional regulator [Alkalispirochaeta sp.]